MLEGDGVAKQDPETKRWRLRNEDVPDAKET